MYTVSVAVAVLVEIAPVSFKYLLVIATMNSTSVHFFGKGSSMFVPRILGSHICENSSSRHFYVGYW